MTLLHPMTGDYVCVNIKGGSLGSRITGDAIRHFTHSDFDHVFVMVNDSGSLVEATPEGARVANISEYAGLEMFVSTTPLLNHERDDISHEALKLVGTPYNFLDIAYLGLYLNHIQSQWLLDRVLNENRMICSQLVAYCGDKAGIGSWLCGKPYSQLVTPGNLATLGLRSIDTGEPYVTGSSR